VNEHPVILFDGICNLCNRSVKLILKYEKEHRFRFAALQSDAAKNILKGFENEAISDSVILIEDGKLFQNSTAALKIAKKLRGYRFLYFLIVIPLWIRDPLYRFIAKHRYRWFGKKDTCMVPYDSIRSRFLG
jgi:predicted DCC family thiol-disulfide oxidoreductase YuxK